MLSDKVYIIPEEILYLISIKEQNAKLPYDKVYIVPEVIVHLNSITEQNAKLSYDKVDIIPEKNKFTFILSNVLEIVFAFMFLE